MIRVAGTALAPEVLQKLAVVVLTGFGVISACTRSMKPIPIYQSVSAEEFRARIQPARAPAILRGLALGDCVQRWSDVDYLCQRTADKLVKIHVTTEPHMDFRAKNFKYAALGLHQLLRRASRARNELVSEPFLDGRELYYLRAVGNDPRARETVRFERDFPALASDFQLPELFDAERYFSSVLRISSPEVRVWTHYDVLDNVYVQVVGHKRALMWAPSQVLNLYLDGDKSRVIDVENPNLDEFPRFGQASAQCGDLEPGDILFIPSMWFHNMKAQDFGVAINVFWQNLDPNLYDPKDPYGNRDLLPAAKALRMLDNVMAQLDKLPEDLKDFYGRQLIGRLEQKCLLNPDP